LSIFFLKKKMGLSSLIRMIATEFLKVPPYTYDDYLSIDPASILAQNEFEAFIRELPFLRLLLLYAMLLDRKNEGQIKVSIIDLGKTFIETTVLSYQDNNVEYKEAQRLSEVFSSELDYLASYSESILEKDLSKNGLTPYACLYFTSKFAEPSEESVKNGVYIALINTQRKLLKEYFDKTLDKIKIVD